MFFWASFKLSCSWVSRRGFCINLLLLYASQSSSLSVSSVYLNYGHNYVYTSSSLSIKYDIPGRKAISFGKCRYSAPLLCTESQPLLSSAVLEVGVWAVSVARTCSMCALLPHLQRWFMARTQATLSELFISTEDKRKSWLYYPDRVGLFTQQTGLSCTGPASHRSDLPFSEAINRPMCAEHQQAVLNAKCYLLEHKFH